MPHLFVFIKKIQYCVCVEHFVTMTNKLVFTYICKLYALRDAQTGFFERNDITNTFTSHLRPQRKSFTFTVRGRRSNLQQGNRSNIPFIVLLIYLISFVYIRKTITPRDFDLIYANI